MLLHETAHGVVDARPRRLVDQALARRARGAGARSGPPAAPPDRAPPADSRASVAARACAAPREPRRELGPARAPRRGQRGDLFRIPGPRGERRRVAQQPAHALEHIRILQDLDFHEFKISVKASDVFLAAAAYQGIAEATDAPIHLGITEAGTLNAGTVKSAIGLGTLLWMGIGDTMRVSLSADPVEEVRVGFEILKSLGLRHRGVNIISCPSCARQGFDVISTVSALEERLAHVRTPLSLSIIGCVVNGPGEALMTDVGFTGGGKDAGMVYVAGRQSHKMTNAQMIDHIVELVERRAAEIEAEAIAAE